MIDVLKKHRASLLAEWVREQMSQKVSLQGALKSGDLEKQCGAFLELFQQTIESAPSLDIDSPAWNPLKEQLREISGTRTVQGFTPSETATFVFSFKRPLFHYLRLELGKDPETLAGVLWSATEVLDALGLYTTEVHQKTREGIISRQQQELLELSTPVVKLWSGILALPLIGTLDSARTQVVMESLLQRIVETGSDIAIIDITGVPTVDTLVAQHLLKTTTAARLMGAECIISGIRPQIAQTIVHLGVDLGSVVTKATLADAFGLAMQKRGLVVARRGTGSGMARKSTEAGEA